jgi:hypothetical protein
MPSKAARVLRMSPAELKIRLRERRDTIVERISAARGVGWRAPRLSGESRELASISRLVASGSASDAGRRLVRELRTHPSRFVIDQARRSPLVREIHATFPRASADAASRAGRLCRGFYDLLGYHDLRFGQDPQGPDWHLDPVSGRRAPDLFWTSVPYLDPKVGDHKVIWELSRHQHWLTLGRAHWLAGSPEYRHRFVGELHSWLAANPPYRGINWASMLELAFRSLSWLWALHLFADEDDQDPSWIVALLGGLDAQLDHVARHLSWYFSPNTHLLGEGLALYVAGRSLPLLARAGAWEALGRRVLLQERHAQVEADGGHAERSLHYHRYALDFYLLAVAIARQTEDVAAAAFEETALRMAKFARSMCDDSGRLMTIGDDDGGMLFPMCGGAPWDVTGSLSVAAALLDDPTLAIGPPCEEALWMAGRTHAPGTGAVSSMHFPDTGYSVLRDRSMHVIFDTGPHGFLNGGHAHADALAITATLDQRPLLIDPGTATYTMDPEVRDRFRSTALHNTVTVDGRDQSAPNGPFHWTTRTDARTLRWITAPGVDYAEGEHCAYAPLRHRRAVLRLPDILLVADHLLGEGRHGVAVNWNTDPAWSLSPREAWMTLQHGEGLSASIGCTAGPLLALRAEPNGAGWVAPVYGQIIPSVTLRASGDQHLPATIISVVTAARRSPVLAFERLTATSAPGEGVSSAGVWIRDDGGATLAVFTASSGAPAPDGQRSSLVVATSGELSTDARAAVLRLSPAGIPETLILIDGGEVTWSGPGAFSVRRPMAELLHLDSSVLRQLSRTDEPRSVI